MIELTRLRLINWHNFQNDVIDFKMVTYLIGVNAVGKTTIMDAIRYCLTTNKNFNAAGNKKSGRTLQGSVHDKQRGENYYLRPGHTVSYIGTEFYDTVQCKSFVIVARVESERPEQELRHVSQDWYITKLGVQLEDLPFIDSKTNAPTKRDHFKLPDQKLEQAANQTDARGRICRVLGIGKADSLLGKKFNEVFHMGTSLDDITDIRQFIYAYVLPEPEINVEALQSDMRELDRLQDVLNESRVRAELLSQITDACHMAQEKEGSVQINEGLILLAKQNGARQEKEQCLQILEQTSLQLQQFEVQLAELKEKRTATQDALVEAKQKEAEQPENQALTYLRDKEKERKSNYHKAVEQKNALENAEGKLDSLLNELSKFTLVLPEFLSLEQVRIQPRDSQPDLLSQVEQIIKAFGPRLTELYAGCYNERESIEAQLKQLQENIRVLKSGQWVYPDGNKASYVKKAVNMEFEVLGMEPDVRILCELLYMTDESWQDSAEACLGGRRFDILVSPSHYRAAKKAFMALGDKVGNISLIDTPNLELDAKSNALPKETELAYKIGSENPYARLYVNHLLHEMVCCESADELERHPRSVTRDLWRHQGYRLQRLWRPVHYIGLNARQEQLRQAETQQKSLLQQQKQVNTQYLSLDQAFSHYNQLMGSSVFSIIQSNWNSPADCDHIYKELQNIQKEIDQYECNPLLRALFNKRERCQKDLDQVEEKIEKQQKRVGQVEKTVQEEQHHQNEVLKIVDETQAVYDDFCKSYPLFVQETVAKYEELSRTRCAAEIARNQTNYSNQLIRARDTFVDKELIPIQQQYNTTYGCDYVKGMDSMEVFQNLHDNLVTIDLERHTENLRQAQLRCKERFRKEILFRMKDDISNAKRQFRELNRVMDKLFYGEEKYQFILNGSKNPELNAFYTIIIDENNEQIDPQGGFFALNAMQNKAYEAQVDDLMQKIMTDVDAASQARLTGERPNSIELSHYVDYRTYLEYDILIQNTVTGKEVPLSQVSGDSSGGENQAPFYVAICSSLLQIYQQSENSIRLVLLDEAFNRMTSDRIRPMMQMFADLKLQLVLISTVEKCSAIYPYCDITHSIIKFGSKNAIMPFVKELS